MKKIYILLFLIANTLVLSSQTWPGDTIGIWSVFDFEAPHNDLVIDTSTQNIWQIGNPQKVIFNSGYYSQNAIVTDTINYYPINNYSYFEIYTGYFNNPIYPYDVFVDFRHKINTDTLKDGGFITVSWDNGQHWTNIINDTNYFGTSPMTGFYCSNLYGLDDTLYNGEYGYSGTSSDWVYSCFSWAVIPVKDIIFPGDTMIIRFNFISDSINNPKEGWLIDQIRLFSIDLGGNIPSTVIENLKVTTESSGILFESSDKVFDSIEIFDLNGKSVLKNEKILKNESRISIITQLSKFAIYRVIYTDGTSSKGKVLLRNN